MASIDTRLAASAIEIKTPNDLQSVGLISPTRNGILPSALSNSSTCDLKEMTSLIARWEEKLVNRALGEVKALKAANGYCAEENLVVRFHHKYYFSVVLMGF